MGVWVLRYSEVMYGVVLVTVVQLPIGLWGPGWWGRRRQSEMPLENKRRSNPEHHRQQGKTKARQEQRQTQQKLRKIMYTSQWAIIRDLES